MRVLMVCAITNKPTSGHLGKGVSTGVAGEGTAGGGSSSTTQEETQLSSGSLLNGQ